MYKIQSVFNALSDTTRLAVIERLCRGSASVSELQAPFSMAGPTFLRHLRVLEDAGLVRSEKRGRVRTVTLDRAQLGGAENWMRERRLQAEAQLDRLEAFLDEEGKPT